jgi:3-oxoacyl-[acyl-carrier-protein] synthase II
LIVERLSHAQERGAHIYAEVLGHASSSDAYDIAKPDRLVPRHPRHALALQDARITPEQVSHINAHGTSTAAMMPEKHAPSSKCLAIGLIAFRLAPPNR